MVVFAGDSQLVAVGGKEAALLISRKAISNSRRKLLAEYLADSGTPKYVVGHCVWEANSYTFVVQTQAAGLAKKLRAAIYKQTDLRAKVRVRGEDGDVDDDGEAVEQEGEESQGQQESGGGTVVDPLKAQFDKLSAEKAAALNALAERLKARLPDGQSAADLAAAALAGSAGDAPDSIRFPYLEVVEGAGLKVE